MTGPRLLSALCCWLVLAAGPVTAAPLLAEFVVNGISRGVYFLQQQGEGWQVERSSLEPLGLAVPAGKGAWVGLADLPGLTAAVDVDTLTVRLTAAPVAQGEQVLVVNPMDRGPPADYAPSFFVNYDLAYATGSANHGSATAASSQGLRFGPALLYNELAWLSDANSTRYQRGTTALYYDLPEQLARLTVGDMLAYAPGEFAQQVRIGGIGIRRAYDMWPTLIRNPMPGFAGDAAAGGRVEVFMDGVRVYSAPVQAGPFQIDNITRYNGLRAMEVVVTDASGRVVSRSTNSVYNSQDLLRAGLSEFEYAVGVVRPTATAEIAAYRKLGFVAAHRYGYSDQLTLGAHVDGVGSYLLAGVDAAYQLGTWGTLSGSLGLAKSRQQAVAPAGSLRYTYATERYNVGLGYKRVDAGFLPVLNLLPTYGQPVLPVLTQDMGVTFGYNFDRGGSLTWATTRSSYVSGGNQTFTTVAYNLPYGTQWSLNALVGYTTGANTPWGAGSGWTAALNFTWFFEQGINALVSVRSTPGSGVTEEVQFMQPAPNGLGFGWSVNVANLPDSRQTARTAGLWNLDRVALYGNVGAATGHGTQAVGGQVGIAGSIVAANGVWALARPVQDSFAVVRVVDQPGVTVFQGGQAMATTDARGVAVVPSLGSYATTRLAVDDASLPYDLYLRQASQAAVPALRGGVLLDFALERDQLVTGTVLWQGGRFAGSPVGGALGTLRASHGGSVEVATTLQGKFFLERPVPGTYVGELTSTSGVCRVQLTVPPSEARQVALDETHCRADW